VRLLLAPPAVGPTDVWGARATARLLDAARAACGPGGRVIVDAGAGCRLVTAIAGARHVGVLLACAPTLSAARRARRLVDAMVARGADGRCALVGAAGPARGDLGARALGRAGGAAGGAGRRGWAREAAALGAGRWPRGGRSRLADAVARLAEGLD
jgi:hypothetical protein